MEAKRSLVRCYGGWNNSWIKRSSSKSEKYKLTARHNRTKTKSN